MANNLGKLNSELIAQESLAILVSKYPFLGSIAQDFSNENVKFGQTIVTRLNSVGPVQDYSPISGYVASDASSTDITVTLNKHKHVSIKFNDQELSSTNRNFVSENAASLAEALANDVMSSVSALITTGNYANATTQAVSGANRTTIILDPRKELSKRGVRGDLFGVYNSDLYFELFKDDSVMNTAHKGNGISTSELPRVHDVAINEFSDLPTNSQNLIGFVGRKDAVLFVSRVPVDSAFSDLPSVARIVTVTDPKTGLSIQLREWYNAQLGCRQVTYTLMYGVAVGNPAALQRIKSA